MSVPVTKESLLASYLEYAHAEAARNSMYIEEPMFQAFCALNPHDIHDMFSTLGYETEFPGNIELYRSIRYCLIDDGDLSFVRARYSVPHPLDGRDRLKFTRYFCMYGNYNELAPSDVLAIAGRYSTGCDKMLVGFRAVPFTEELLSVMAERRSFLEQGPDSCGNTREMITAFKQHEHRSHRIYNKHIKTMMHTDRHKTMQPLGRSSSCRARIVV